MFESEEEADFIEDQEYPDELHPISEVSDWIFDLVEKLERVQKRLDNFEEEYLQADQETRESMEMPSEWLLKAWMEFLERADGEINSLGDPI